MIEGTAFYCISSELYFPGALGLINSLRLVGHSEPIHLLDCGLTDAHRELVDDEVVLVEGSPDTPPYLLKTAAPARHPARTMVLIDVDMIATRSLAPLVELASPSGVVAFKDNLDRFVPSWGRELGLGPARPRPYVSSGLIVLAGEVGAAVLDLWDRHIREVSYRASHFAERAPGYPFLYLDQDVLNAILAAAVAPDCVTTLPRRLAATPPFTDVRLLDERTMRCALDDGSEPYVLHQFVRKPWLEPMYHSVYSRLLRRLWIGEDVAARLPPEEVPLRMRAGPRAFLERKRVDLVDLVRWYARDVIPEWLAERRGSPRTASESRP